VTRESSPHCGWRIPATPAGSLRHEQKEVYKCIAEKTVHHIAHPVGRILQDDFPQIPSVDVPHESLSNEDGRNPNDEDTDMQYKEKSLGCHTASHHSSDMNPQADDETNRRKANENPEKGSDPLGDGVRSREGLGRDRSSVLQQALDIRFEQYRSGRVGRIATDCHGFTFKVTNELLGFRLGRESAPVAP
jgi:hypothetical protein